MYLIPANAAVERKRLFSFQSASVHRKLTDVSVFERSGEKKSFFSPQTFVCVLNTCLCKCPRVYPFCLIFAMVQYSAMSLKHIIPSYPHLVVYDTEFTTWEGALERGWSGEHEYRELVQIAAQKINLETQTVLDQFEQLVRPVINPQLSDYFVELTQITQGRVDTEGVLFAEMYDDFMSWSAGVDKYSYQVESDDAVVLQENIDLYQLSARLDRSEFGNLRPIFQNLGVDVENYNSGNIHRYFNIPLTGKEHDAMFDVTSLVQSLFAISRQ